MLAFRSDKTALAARKSVDCIILYKRLRYSNRAVSNSNRTVIKANSRWNTLTQQPIKRKTKLFEAETLH